MLSLCLLRHDLPLCRRLHYLLPHRSTFSTTTTRTASSALHIPLSHPAYVVWSANTSLGKTLVSAGVAYSFLRSSPSKFFYLKPLQTGFPSDSDARFVFTKVSSLFSRSCAEGHSISLIASNSVLKSSVSAAKSLLGSGFEPKKCEHGLCDLEFYDEKRVVSEVSKTSDLVCQTLYAWEEAVSPHLAAEREGGAVEDLAVVDMFGKFLNIGLEGDPGRERLGVFGLIETAGGVASPGPSGSLQCDLYRYVNPSSSVLLFI